MADWLGLFGTCILGVAMLLTVVFGYAHSKKRYDVIDVFWGPAILLSTVIALLTTRSVSPAAWVVTVMVALWALRLASHIGRRFWRSTTQDPRYTRLIDAMPLSARPLHIYLRIYLVQALLAVMVSVAPIVVMTSAVSTSVWVPLGVAIWCVGVIYEAVADRQLAYFLTRSHASGAVMKTGLWRYSRHPNYFGEIVIWWGVWVMSCASPYALVALVSPLLMTMLLMFVSGVPQAEARMNTKPDWQTYKASTPVLVPRFWPR